MHSVIPHRFLSPVVLSHTLSAAVAVPAALLSVLVLSAVVLRRESLLHAYSAITNQSWRMWGVRLSQTIDSDGQSRLLSSWRWLRQRELLWTLATWAGGRRHF